MMLSNTMPTIRRTSMHLKPNDVVDAVCGGTIGDFEVVIHSAGSLNLFFHDWLILRAKFSWQSSRMFISSMTKFDHITYFEYDHETWWLSVKVGCMIFSVQKRSKVHKASISNLFCPNMSKITTLPFQSKILKSFTLCITWLKTVCDLRVGFWLLYSFSNKRRKVWLSKNTKLSVWKSFFKHPEISCCIWNKRLDRLKVLPSLKFSRKSRSSSDHMSQTFFLWSNDERAQVLWIAILTVRHRSC